MGLKAEGIQPGCVAIGIRSEEAKPLSSDYVCSLSSYCCRDGSFEDFGYGSAACSQPNSIQDYEQGRYKGVSTPLRRCHVRPFGVARREAFIKSTKQCFSGGGSHVALVCRCSNAPARNDLWSTYPIPTVGWCDKSIFGCEHSLGAKPMDKVAASSLCTENVGVCLFGYEICRPCSAQLWPCGMLAVAESSLCVGVFDIHRPGFCGGRCAGQAEENIVRGRDHRRGPKEAAGTFIKGVFRCLFVGEWHQRPRCRELPKGRTTFGSGCLGYFCLAELSEGLRKSRAMRQHFPMNLHGKQIGHVLGYIPGTLYGQAVLQGMSRAYQGVLEEANRTIVEFRLRATTPASSAMTPLTPPSAAPPADLLAVAQSKAVPPASGVSGFDITPHPTAFQHPWGGVLFY